MVSGRFFLFQFVCLCIRSLQHARRFMAVVARYLLHAAPESATAQHSSEFFFLITHTHTTHRQHTDNGLGFFSRFSTLCLAPWAVAVLDASLCGVVKDGGVEEVGDE